MDIRTVDYGNKEHELAMQEVLMDLAMKHIEESDGKLVPISINPDLYPSQKAYHLVNDNLMRDPKTIEQMATFAEPRFPGIQKRVDSWSENSEIFDFMATAIKKDMNVAVVTNHGVLTDIALVQAAICNRLTKLGDEELMTKMRTAIIISKIVSMMGVALKNPDAPAPGPDEPKYPAPGAAEVLGNLLCNDVFLSFPRTPSIEKALGTFGGPRIRHHNRAVKKALSRSLDKGGVLLAVAPSGTKDKPVEGGDPNERVMAELTEGTRTILIHGKTLVLPLAVLLEGTDVSVELCGGLQAVNSERAAHGVQQQICDKANELVLPPTRFSYAKPSGPGKPKSGDRKRFGY